MKTFLILLLFFSCTQHHEVKFENGVHFFQDIKVELSNLKEIDWKIGRKREKNISKGIRFSIEIPRLESKSKEIIMQKYGADSWVYRVTKLTRRNKQVLGHLYFSFSNMTRTTSYYTLSVFYAASAASKRFRLFHCPAFDHRKKIVSFDIEDTGLRQNQNFYVRSTERLNAKTTRLRFAPMIVSGGKLLQGTYLVEFALFDSRNKQLASSWKKAEQVIQVAKEEEVFVASCAGIKEENIPLPESKMPTLRDLEIK